MADNDALLHGGQVAGQIEHHHFLVALARNIGLRIALDHGPKRVLTPGNALLGGIDLPRAKVNFRYHEPFFQINHASRVMLEIRHD
jgi:hypothetical protein